VRLEFRRRTVQCRGWHEHNRSTEAFITTYTALHNSVYINCFRVQWEKKKKAQIFTSSRNSANSAVKVKVELSLYLTKHHAMKMYRGSGGIAPRILDLDTGWRWVVSFTPRPLYPQGKSLWYPSDRRLGGPQSRSGRGGEEKKSQPPPRESNPRTPIV
jgi:hypothetical protein